jgi:hypothetical protein
MWWQTTNSKKKIVFHSEEFFLLNNLNKLLLEVDFTARGLNQLQIIHSIYSANFLQCMNVNNEGFDIFVTHRCPRKRR